MKHTKSALMKSVLALLACVSMLIGSTFAWFTDSVSSDQNVIQSGNLDLEMYWSTSSTGPWHNVEEAGYNTIFNYDNWEPGYTDVKYVKLVNNGSLALNYELTITPESAVGKLAEVIQVYFDREGGAIADRADLADMGSLGSLKTVLNGGAVIGGTLLAADQSHPTHPIGETVFTLAMSMITSAGNDYQNETAGEFSITALATQAPYEEDSFGPSYDNGAELPIVLRKGSASALVSTANNVVTAPVTLAGDGIAAHIPAGVAVEEGAERLTLTVTPLDSTDSGLVAVNQEVLIPVDVHVNGVAEDNTTPIVIDLGAILPPNMNVGNYTFFHVVDGVNQPMTLVADAAALTAHNTFTYDPLTGDVSVAMASFSEVVALADTSNEWKGTVAASFAGGSGTAAAPYVIANADQLVYLGDRVSNDNANYGSAHYQLVADLNFGGASNTAEAGIFYPIGYNKVGGEIAALAEDEDAILFEPISAAAPGDKDGDVAMTMADNSWYTYGGSFKGTFDGMGHTVTGIYQNTWAMRGNYSGYYYNDAMGLFGYVNGGTVKNLTVDNFRSEGEFAPTGCVTAYAGGSATFENIAVTGSHPQTYNTGVAGIVGWDNGNSTNLTFKNITVDDSNTVSALWGSWDVAASGILGSLKSGSKASFENCNVAATIDVYNDVCGNYQYYWYRYSGAYIGTVYKRLDNGNGALDLSDVTAKNCFVNFGDRHEYYYCEQIENTKASYTHDYQMSRILRDGVEYRDGKACCITHNHEEHGYETVNGESVLVEDKQAVYIPYRQLFGGYGWGVDGVDLGEYENIDISDITTARTKFETVYDGGNIVCASDKTLTLKVSDLFAALDGVSVNSSGVYVTIDPVDDEATAKGVYNASADNWMNGTVTVSGTGMLKLTIQDYDFCAPTSLYITIVEPDAEAKFASKLTRSFLYRVGNSGAVALGKLFASLDGVAVNSSDVVATVETVEGTASGAFAANADWKAATLTFSGTGVVKVTVTDNYYCTPTTLYLEVVNATNVTGASGSNGANIVLLNDIKVSAGGNINYTNCTVYGNGFTVDVRGGMNEYNSKQGHGIIITSGATLDNMVILGDVYDTYGAYTNQADYTSAIDATNTVIQNCHISNCSAPIRANGVTVVNSTLYGGTVANMIISGGVNTLTDVTTVNYNDGRGVLGFGIVISDGANETVKLILNGELKQHNFVCEDDASSVPDDNAKKLFNSMFDSAYSAYHITANGETYVNTGILSMVSTFDSSDITNNTDNGYVGATVSYDLGLTTAQGYLYSIPASGNSVDNGYNAAADSHKAGVQGDYLPTFHFDLGSQAITNDGADDTRYLTGNKAGVEALYQNNEAPIDLDLTKLVTAYKYDGVSYSVSASYKDASGKLLGTNETVSLTASGTLVFTVTDNVFYDATGAKVDKSVVRTLEVPLTVSVKQAAVKNAVITVSKTTLTGTYTNAGTFDSSKYLSFNPLEAITITDYDANGNGTTVDLTKNISNTTVTYVNTTSGAWGGATITMTYTDGRELTVVLGSTTMNSPGASNGGKTITVTNGTVKSDGKVAQKSATGGTWPITSYSFKGNNGSTVTKAQTVDVTFADKSGCVTGDTLVTLADGSQKRIDEVTYSDTLLVWDFFEGKYATVPAAIIFYHGDELYEVLTLHFEDGTDVKTINVHGFFDADENEFIFIERGNVEDYIGHKFVKTAGNGYETVALVGFSVTEEYTGCYSIQSAFHNNFITEGMFSVTIPAFEGWFDYFEIGEGMRYDEVQMRADIERYGLYSYDDFADYVTYEQFMAFNGPYLKVLVGRGIVTREDILNLIASYVN